MGYKIVYSNSLERVSMYIYLNGNSNYLNISFYKNQKNMRKISSFQAVLYKNKIFEKLEGAKKQKDYLKTIQKIMEWL
ncbi:hypothetical protein D3C71_2166940 [compost metagenome]